MDENLRLVSVLKQSLKRMLLIQKWLFGNSEQPLSIVQ